jgi:hypothetical protein
MEKPTIEEQKMAALHDSLMESRWETIKAKRRIVVLLQRELDDATAEMETEIALFHAYYPNHEIVEQ